MERPNINDSKYYDSVDHTQKQYFFRDQFDDDTQKYIDQLEAEKKELIEENKQLKENIYIPYQGCPVCQGEGQILADGFTSNVYQVCPCCKGDRKILMYLQNRSDQLNK